MRIVHRKVSDLGQSGGSDLATRCKKWLSLAGEKTVVVFARSPQVLGQRVVKLAFQLTLVLLQKRVRVSTISALVLLAATRAGRASCLESHLHMVRLA